MSKMISRHNSIIEKVQTLNYQTVRQLADALKVSEMTIRRDIQMLAGKGYLKQVYGGVMSSSERKTNPEYALSDEMEKNIEKKKRIAAAAVDLLNPGDVIFLDTGTTVLTLARMLPKDLPLTIITPSFTAIEALVNLPNIRLICPGGHFAPKQKTFYQSDVANNIEGYRANKSFIGAAGYDMNLGLTCYYPEDVLFKQAMMKLSQEKVLLLDSAKFNQVSTCVYGNIEDFSKIITDEDIPLNYLEDIEHKHVEIILT